MTTVDLARFERDARALDTTRAEPAAIDRLVATARILVAGGRGILAADESDETASKRLVAHGVHGSAESRRRYRQWLVTAPGLADHVSGVILYDETFRQALDDGTTFPHALAGRGILPGIKADTGTKPLAGHPGEEVTAGLDGLRERLVAYARAGARFAKWRAVIRIADGLPTAACLEANAHALARYAALCQEVGLVPMVEPEVLMDGDHGIERDEEVTTRALRALYEQFDRQGVLPEATVLKVNMVLAGTAARPQPTVEQVAAATVRCLTRAVPAAVPGVAFLSGGQSPLDATIRLDAINRLGPHPWALTFSYARALQGPAMDRWAGDPANQEAAQLVLVHRARCNAAAAAGGWTPDLEAVQVSGAV